MVEAAMAEAVGVVVDEAEAVGVAEALDAEALDATARGVAEALDALTIFMDDRPNVRLFVETLRATCLTLGAMMRTQYVRTYVRNKV